MSELESTPRQEVGPLARELATAFGEQLAFYRKHYKLTSQEAEAKYRENADGYLDLIRTKDPANVDWGELEFLATHNEAEALQRWEEIKAAALDELQTGHRAAGILEVYGPGPMQRARFLAIRAELHDGWQPRNAIERQLLDTMAQAQALYMFWLEKMALWATMEAVTDRRLREEGSYLPPRLRDSECVQQAGEMVDRFNRIFLRTLRALRDLRRYAPTVVVQNAAQVNVGQQQVNVTG